MTNEQLAAIKAHVEGATFGVLLVNTLDLRDLISSLEAAQERIAMLEAQLVDAPDISHFSALKNVAREAAKDHSDDLNRAIEYARDIGAL